MFNDNDEAMLSTIYSMANCYSAVTVSLGPRPPAHPLTHARTIGFEVKQEKLGHDPPEADAGRGDRHAQPVKDGGAAQAGALDEVFVAGPGTHGGGGEGGEGLHLLESRLEKATMSRTQSARRVRKNPMLVSIAATTTIDAIATPSKHHCRAAPSYRLYRKLENKHGGHGTGAWGAFVFIAYSPGQEHRNGADADHVARGGRLGIEKHGRNVQRRDPILVGEGAQVVVVGQHLTARLKVKCRVNYRILASTTGCVKVNSLAVRSARCGENKRKPPNSFAAENSIHETLPPSPRVVSIITGSTL